MENFEVFVVLVVCLTSSVLARDCIQEGQCVCRIDDGSGVIDLSGIGLKDGTPLINMDASSPVDPYLYSYNPCYPFTQGTCTNVAGCQIDEEKSVYYAIGDAKSTSLAYDDKDKSLVATYTSDDGLASRTTTVKFLCDPAADTPKYTVSGEPSPTFYEFEITSKYACPTTPPPTSPMPSTTAKRECYKIDQCRCEFNDGSGILDLSVVGRNDGTPLINKEYLPDNFTYSFNPCYAFKEGPCKNVAACQHNLGDTTLYYNIGVQTRVSFSYDGSNVVGTYLSDDLSRKSIVTYTCNPNMVIPAYTVEGEIAYSTYGFTIIGKDICPRPAVVSKTPSPSITMTPLASTTRVDIKKECIQKDQCQCEFNDGSGVVDFSKIGLNDGEPLINSIFAADNYAYSFNPCYPFIEYTCLNAAACQYDATNVISYNIGDSSKVEFSYDGLNVIGTYVSDDGARTSLVTYICDPNVDIPTYSVDGEISTATYGFSIRSRYACPCQLMSASTTTIVHGSTYTSSQSASTSRSTFNPWDRFTTSTVSQQPETPTSPSSRSPFNPWDRFTTSTVSQQPETPTSPSSRSPFNPWDRFTTSTVSQQHDTPTSPSSRSPFNPWDRFTTSTVSQQPETPTSPSSRSPFNPWDRFTTSTVSQQHDTPTSPSSRSPFNPWDRFTTSTVSQQPETPTSPSSRSPFNPWDRFTTSTVSQQPETPTSPSSRSTFNPWDRFTTSTVSQQHDTPTSPSSRSPFNPWDRFTTSTVSQQPETPTSPSSRSPFNPWDRFTTSTVSQQPETPTSPSSRSPFNPWDRFTTSTVSQQHDTPTSPSSRSPFNPWDRFTTSTVSSHTTIPTAIPSRSSFNPWDTTIRTFLSTIKTNTTKIDIIPFENEEGIAVGQSSVVPIIVGCAITGAVVLLVVFILYYCKYSLHSKLDDQEMKSVPGFGDKGDKDYRRF